MIKPWQKYLMTITLPCCSAIKDNQHQTERDKKAIDLIIWKKEEKISTNKFTTMKLLSCKRWNFG